MMKISHSFEESISSARLSPVVLSVLGTFRFSVGGNSIPIDSESKAAHLLFCLVLAKDYTLPCTQLLERLWPQVDPALASQSLHSLVHYLRKITKEFLAGASIILYKNGYYQLNVAKGVWIDLEHFNAWSKHGKSLLVSGNISEGITYCQQALNLYEGDLCGYGDLETILERERLRTVFLDLLALMAEHYYTHGNPTEALNHLSRLIAHEPCREDAHRQVMRCYMKLNQRTQALRQYRLCCQALAVEFDIQPEPATVALFEQIRSNPTSLTEYKDDSRDT